MIYGTEIIQLFNGYVFVKDVAKFVHADKELILTASEFDSLFRGHQFWYKPDNTHGKAKRASTAFLKNEFSNFKFPKVDRLVMTTTLPPGSIGVDEFGYSYVTMYGIKP